MTDERWEHPPGEVMYVSIVAKERVANFGDLPYPVQQKMRVLAYPPDPDSVAADVFENMHRWQRSDGITTYIAREKGDRDIYFCDFKDGNVIANAALAASSLTKIFVEPPHRHHYEAAHLLITLDHFLQAQGTRLDSGALTAISDALGHRPPESYELSHKVWKRLVDAGFAKPLFPNGQKKNGPPSGFIFIDRESH